MYKTPTIKLNSSNDIPLLGFGTWQLNGQECVNSVRMALELGYEHIDTADAYQNHVQVAKGIAESGIDRDGVFLTTKIWRDRLKSEDLRKDVDRFLNELKTNYIDLLLIHWPNDAVDMYKTVKSMNNLKKDGVIRSIGISNFNKSHIKDLLENIKLDKRDDILIDNHQFEIHPSLNQTELINLSRSLNMTVTAYSPIAQGQDLKMREVDEIAGKYSVSPAQVILAWLRSKEIVSIIRSKTEQHIKANFDSLQVELSQDDIKILDSLNSNNRIVSPSFAKFD